MTYMISTPQRHAMQWRCVRSPDAQTSRMVSLLRYNYSFAYRQ